MNSISNTYTKIYSRSEILEQFPDVFLEILKQERDIYVGKVEQSKDHINSKEHKQYSNYLSPLITSLIYLVGDLSDQDEIGSIFYGSNTVIHEDMGIEILDLMMERIPYIHDVNYYNESAYSIVANYNSDKGSLTHRTNNTKFLRRFMEHAERY
jgi:hypothetical protein